MQIAPQKLRSNSIQPCMPINSRRSYMSSRSNGDDATGIRLRKRSRSRDSSLTRDRANRPWVNTPWAVMSTSPRRNRQPKVRPRAERADQADVRNPPPRPNRAIIMSSPPRWPRKWLFRRRPSSPDRRQRLRLHKLLRPHSRRRRSLPHRCFRWALPFSSPNRARS